MADKTQQDADTPTLTVYEVASTHTGAVVGRHALETDAQRECERLNDEARAHGIKHHGKLMQYKVSSPAEIFDMVASAEEHVARVEALLRQPKSKLPAGIDADALATELEQALANLEAVKRGA